MTITKCLHGVWATVASICVAAAGVGLLGGAIAVAQESDPFGDGGSEADVSSPDPFGGNSFAEGESADPFGAPKPQSNPNQVGWDGQGKPKPQSKPNQVAWDGQGKKAAGKKSVWERLRVLGHYGLGSETDDEIRILEALAQKTSLHVDQEALENVMAIISERHHIQIFFDRRALEDENIDPSSDTISIDLSNIRLQSALNLALQQLGLSMVPRDEVLMITSRSAAEQNLTTRLYKLPESWPQAGKEMKNAIIAVVTPDSWDEVGGPGTIQIIPGGLIVSNTHEVHLGINKLFAQCEKLYGDE